MRLKLKEPPPESLESIKRFRPLLAALGASWSAVTVLALVAPGLFADLSDTPHAGDADLLRRMAFAHATLFVLIPLSAVLVALQIRRDARGGGAHLTPIENWFNSRPLLAIALCAAVIPAALHAHTYGVLFDAFFQDRDWRYQSLWIIAPSVFGATVYMMLQVYAVIMRRVFKIEV
ncbi:MAG: hypothetical protein AAF909_07345 [Pseudomonadota bacterium]